MVLKVDQSLRDYIYSLIQRKIDDEFDFLKGFKVFFNPEFKPPEEDIYFRVSQLTGCLRKEWFRNKGYKQVKTPDDIITLTTGTLWHSFIQMVMEDSLIDFEKELTLQLSTGHKLIGHYDGIMDFQGKRVLLEFKTASVQSHKYLLKELAFTERTGKVNFGTTLYRYLLQDNTYYKMLLEAEGKSAEGIWIVMIYKSATKDIPYLFSFYTEYEPEFAEVLIRKAKAVDLYLKEDKLPPPTKEMWECRYCGYINCPLNPRYKKGGEKSEGVSDNAKKDSRTVEDNAETNIKKDSRPNRS